jgi:hypothetical protein
MARLFPYQAIPGLYAESSEPSGGGRIYHTWNMTRARLRNTNLRSKSYSAFSTHRSRPSMKPSVRVNALVATIPPQPLHPRAVRLHLFLRRHVRYADRSLIFSAFSTSTPARERLIKRAFALHELPSLIEAIFSGNDADDTIRCLLGEDAQTFIDVMDEARFTFTHRESINRS